MDILQIRTNKYLINQTVEISGVVIGSYQSKGGYWLNIRDKTGNIFIFSRDNFGINESLKIRGNIKLYGGGRVYIYSTKIIKVFEPAKATITPPIQEPIKQEKPRTKLNIPLLLITIIVVIIAIGFFVGNSIYKRGLTEKSNLNVFQTNKEALTESVAREIALDYFEINKTSDIIKLDIVDDKEYWEVFYKVPGAKIRILTIKKTDGSFTERLGDSYFVAVNSSDKADKIASYYINMRLNGSVLINETWVIDTGITQYYVDKNTGSFSYRLKNE